MSKYVVKRVLLALATAFIVLSLTFILLNCLPVDKVYLPSQGAIYSYYMDQVNRGFLYVSEFENSSLGAIFDQVTMRVGGRDVTYFFYQTPVMVRYGNWLSDIFTKWDWGVSQAYQIGRSNIDILASALPVTISINLLSVLFSVPLGIGLGVICALKKGSIFDNIMQVVIMTFISIPSFVLVSYLIAIASNTGDLPVYWPDSSASAGDKALAYIIPVITLASGSLFGYARFVRAELCEVLQSDYLLLARTKGLTKGQAIMKHAFRNSMVPVLPSIVSEFIAILGGSMILENLYGIPGVGRLYMSAFTSKDYSLLMTDMAFYTLIGLLSGIVVDLSYGFIDPRIRMGAKK